MRILILSFVKNFKLVDFLTFCSGGVGGDFSFFFSKDEQNDDGGDDDDDDDDDDDGITSVSPNEEDE